MKILLLISFLALAGCDEDTDVASPTPEVDGTRLSCFTLDTDDATIITDYNDSDTDGDCPRDVIIPDGITEIGARSFESKSLTSVVIPESVTSIKTRAFETNSLTSLTIPNGVTRIGSGAFGYNELTSVTIPASITAIAESPFYNNPLTSVCIEADAASITFGPDPFPTGATVVYETDGDCSN